MNVARALARTHPDLITTKWKKSERHGVLVDANQNGLGRTTAAAYSVRPRPGATVATPLASFRSRLSAPVLARYRPSRTVTLSA